MLLLIWVRHRGIGNSGHGLAGWMGCMGWRGWIDEIGAAAGPLRRGPQQNGCWMQDRMALMAEGPCQRRMSDVGIGGQSG